MPTARACYAERQEPEALARARGTDGEYAPPPPEKSLGLQALLSTVNDRLDLERFITLGGDGIISASRTGAATLMKRLPLPRSRPHSAPRSLADAVRHTSAAHTCRPLPDGVAGVLL